MGTSESAPTNDDVTHGLKVYMVGGAVRDCLLGIGTGDRDWVVVGASPQQMLSRGFIPVGADFPVFLHPVTKEEYALARTERKSGRGYKGFTFYTGADVTLEDDLSRRDLTINAIARSPEGTLVDPYNGVADLRAGVLRHVGPAFSEDPVRLLRLARFAARFPDFVIAEETLCLARDLVAAGEVDALVAERVWQELAKALDAPQPGRMLEILSQVGARERIMPGLVVAPTTAQELACARAKEASLAACYALLCRHSGTAIPTLSRHLKVPRACQEQAVLFPRLLALLETLYQQRPLAPTNPWDAEHAGTVVDIVERCDGLRRSERFFELLEVVSCVWPSRPDLLPWHRLIAALKDVDAAAIAQQAQGDIQWLKTTLHAARIAAVNAVFDAGYAKEGGVGPPPGNPAGGS